MLRHSTFLTWLCFFNVSRYVFGMTLGFMEPQITSQVKIFPKVEHGWTTRYNVEDEAACKAAEEAYEDLMAWFLNLLYCEEAFSDISE